MTKPVCFVLFAMVPAFSGVVAPQWGNLPLRFEPNTGQAPSEIRYLAHGNGYSLALTSTSATLSRGGSPVRIQFDGANKSATPRGEQLLESRSSYLLGNNPKEWRTNIENYGRVRFQSVYPGIDLVYYGRGDSLEYDFVVAPGSSASSIALSFENGRPVSISPEGELLLDMPQGRVRQPRPEIYQEIGGVRCPVIGGYELLSENRIGFKLGDYDRDKPLIIDPVLQFATFYGGRILERALNVAVDSAGNIYVAGLAASPDFPSSPGAYQTRVIGGNDIFVAKLNSTGTTVLYSTLVGGSADETGAYIAVDSLGSAYVSGTTTSANFPVTPGAFREQAGGGASDGFVFKLNSTGSNLVYSTRIGGAGTDNVRGIAVDTSLSAYVTGDTDSSNFPVTTDVFQVDRKGNMDAFVTKLAPSGSSVVWSTLLGGDSDSFTVAYEAGRVIAVDRIGQVYVAGITTLRDFPTKSNNPQYHGGQGDVFVTKFSSDAKQILFSLLMGGAGVDTVNAISIDINGTNLLIGGTTNSTNFPVTPQVFQTFSNQGSSQTQANEGFVARIDAGGTIIYSTYFGGRGDDQVNGIVADVGGAAYFIGTTSSTDLPTTFDAIQKNISSGSTGEPFDAFVAYLDPFGQSVPFATYLGGPRNEEGNGIARDSQGNLYVVGYTQSSGFPLTPGALQKTTGFGTNTAFIARIGDNRLPASSLVMISGNNQTADESRPFADPLIVELRDPFNSPVSGGTVTFAVTNGVISSNAAITGGDGRARVLVTAGGRPGPVTVVATFANLPPITFNLTSRRVGPPLPTINPGGVVSFGESTPRLNRLAVLGLGVVTGTAFAQSGNDRDVAEGDRVNGQLPTNFLNTCVTIDDVPARLLYVSPFRIHFQVPEISRAGQVPLVVISNCGILGELRSDPYLIDVQRTAPEFLYWTQNFDGRNPVRAINLDTGVEVKPESPANPSSRVRLFGTGFGPTSPSTGAGDIPQSAANTTISPVVTFDGRPLAPENVIGSAVLPGYPGFYTLDIQIPSGTRNGNLPIIVQYGDQVSPAGGYIRIAGGLDLDPRLTLSSNTLSFGDVIVGQTRDLPLTIANSGSFELNINAFDAGRVEYQVIPNQPFQLAPGESRVLTIRFTSNQLGIYPSTLLIASSDPTNPNLAVALSANVIVQPPAPNPAPVVTSIQPDSVTAGGAPFNLIVNGRDFTRSSVVEVNGQARPTFFSFSNQLIASVRAQDVADPADLRITVFTPAPGGGRSAGFTLTVRAPLAGNQPFALINQIDMRFCPDVTSYVSVIDGNGNPVRNLATPNLVCREDNNPITCNLTQAAANTPLSVVLVYGVNGLTTQEDQFFIKAAARNFVTSLADGDRVQVVHLEDVARLQQDFTEDKQKVLNVLDLLIPAGPGNALYDAVNFSAVNASRQLNRRQAVVLFTALDNLSGTFGLDQALGVARNLGVPFYTIAVGQGGSNVNLTGFLRQLSRDTQGQFFSESAFLNYNGLFQRLNTVIQSQYAIQHTAPIFNGQNRNLQFSFTIPEGTVSATRVYRPCAP